MSEKLDRINKALSIPETLFSSDGREFKVRRWSPVADYQKPELVQISAELIVKVDGEFVVARQQKPQIAFNNLYNAQEFAKMLKDEMSRVKISGEEATACS